MKRKNLSKKDEDLLIEDLKSLEGYINDLWLFFPIPICFTNTAFNILNISKTLEDVTGYKEIEIIGEGLERILKNSKRLFKELTKKEIILDNEMILLAKGKKEILVSVLVKARKDGEGDLLGYFFSFIDLSEVKEKEKELQKKVKELEKFRKAAVGRELKMIELKKEIKRFKK